MTKKKKEKKNEHHAPVEISFPIKPESAPGDRKKAEEASSRKETFWEAQVESTLDGILVVDRNRQIILMNRRFLDIFHVPPQLYGVKNNASLLRHVMELTKDPKALLAKIEHLYEHPDETSRDEIEFKDGMVLDRYSSPVLGIDGKYYGRTWTFRDITEHKKMIGELRESQQRLSDIIDFLPDATFVIDKDGRVIAWNKAIEEMTGCKAADMLGKGHYEYALPFYGERRPILIDLVAHADANVENKYVKTSRGDQVLEGEAYMPAPRGGEVYLYGKASILRDSRGNIAGAIESIRDITYRRRVEQKYKSIFDNSIAGIYQATPEGRFLSANFAMARILGYESPEELIEAIQDIGRQLYVNPEDRLAFMKTITNSGIVREWEIQFYRKDGSTAWLTLNAVAVKDRNQQVMYYEGSVLDITERKLLEFQLRQVQKMEAMGTLAGGIAHDFNNILSAVIGYADMAQREPEISDRLRRYAEQIYKAGIRAGELIKQILTFSRQSEEKLYPLNLTPLVKEALKLLRSSLPSTLEIHEEIATDADAILANPTFIYQILMNLCTNAAQAMKEGKGKIYVGLSRIEIRPDDVLIHDGLFPGQHVHLTVADTGEGIAPHIVHKIFDPFFTTKKPGEGTGMGLSVVHGIVKKCGGAITVLSEQGKGTAFHIYFPFLENAQEERPSVPTVNIEAGKGRILLVDDEQSLVDLGKSMIQSMGYQVEGKTSSRDALKLFRRQPGFFDLVITDMTMPDMSGLDLAQTMKRIRPDIPIIICTGYSAVLTQDKLAALGVKEVIMKPMTMNQLAKAIHRELEKKGS